MAGSACVSRLSFRFLWLWFSKPTCRDLILTNKKELFKNSKTFEVGISDHHLLTLTSMRIQVIKGNPKVKFYRDYKSFNFESFNNDLDGLLKAENNMNYSTFQNILFHKISVDLILNSSNLTANVCKKRNFFVLFQLYYSKRTVVGTPFWMLWQLKSLNIFAIIVYSFISDLKKNLLQVYIVVFR